MGHIVETGTTPRNTKETSPMLEINYITQILTVEIHHETSVEMSIRRKIRDIREGLEIIMKTSMRTGMVGINTNTNTEMTNMTKDKDRLKEKHCSHGDKSFNSFYSELEELYSSIPYFTVEVNVQDPHNLPTKVIAELGWSDIHLIEQYILDKEEMEAQELEECIVELPNKQEIDREMEFCPKCLQKHLVNKRSG